MIMSKFQHELELKKGYVIQFRDYVAEGGKNIPIFHYGLIIQAKTKRWNETDLTVLRLTSGNSNRGVNWKERDFVETINSLPKRVMFCDYVGKEIINSYVLCSKPLTVSRFDVSSVVMDLYGEKPARISEINYKRIINKFMEYLNLEEY